MHKSASPQAEAQGLQVQDQLGALSKTMSQKEGLERWLVDWGFCPAQSHIHSVPNKHTEVDIHYK